MLLQIDKLIPTSWSDATIEAVNTAIPGWVQSHTTSQSPIAIADCSRAAGFTNAMLNSDGVHPNGQGDQFIAKQVGPKLIQFINDVLGGTTTPTPSSSASSSAGSPQPTGCAPMWGQCGGRDYTGPTCCAQGTCKVSNEYYSQCL
jgi:hypothetical protein